MSQQIFCGRPGCAHTELMHGRLGGACSNFIAPSSKEARALEATKVESSPVDSSLLDRVLMAGALEHLQTRIKTATEFLQQGMSFTRAGMQGPAMARFHDALKALGGLGAS